MSKQLHEESIHHELHYVGIINDVIQKCNAKFEDCIHAAETGEFKENVPKTREQLPDSANHYTIIVPRGRERMVVEPCSELRDENFRSVYVGKWPTEDYLPLKNSRLDKESRFSHFK